MARPDPLNGSRSDPTFLAFDRQLLRVWPEGISCWVGARELRHRAPRDPALAAVCWCQPPTEMPATYFGAEPV